MSGRPLSLPLVSPARHPLHRVIRLRPLAVRLLRGPFSLGERNPERTAPRARELCNLDLADGTIIPSPNRLREESQRTAPQAQQAPVLDLATGRRSSPNWLRGGGCRDRLLPSGSICANAESLVLGIWMRVRFGFSHYQRWGPISGPSARSS